MIILLDSDVRASLLLDEKDNWVGFSVFNDVYGEGTIILPNLHNLYVSQKNEIVKMSKESISVYFDSTYVIDRNIEAECNIDFNDNGLLGFEFILTDFAGKFEIASKFY